MNNRCTGYTLKGERCKNRPSTGNEYCDKHRHKNINHISLSNKPEVLCASNEYTFMSFDGSIRPDCTNIPPKSKSVRTWCNKCINTFAKPMWLKANEYTKIPKNEFVPLAQMVNEKNDNYENDNYEPSTNYTRDMLGNIVSTAASAAAESGKFIYNNRETIGSGIYNTADFLGSNFYKFYTKAPEVGSMIKSYAAPPANALIKSTGSIIQQIPQYFKPKRKVRRSINLNNYDISPTRLSIPRHIRRENYLRRRSIKKRMLEDLVKKRTLDRIYSKEKIQPTLAEWLIEKNKLIR